MPIPRVMVCLQLSLHDSQQGLIDDKKFVMLLRQFEGASYQIFWKV